MEEILLVIILLLLGLLVGPLIGVLVLSGRVKKLEARIRSLEKDVSVSLSSKVVQTAKTSGGQETQGHVPSAPGAEGVRRPAEDLTKDGGIVKNSPQDPGGQLRTETPRGGQLSRPVSPGGSHCQEPMAKPSKKKETPLWLKNLFSVESIISKLGILLMLIGVGFIFKLAYDNGYITEELAVLMGAVIGAVLTFLGTRVALKGRKILSQVLLGGGVATFYITTYAAYQGYGLIQGILAFMFMCAVTAGAFVLALMTDSVAMAFIAIIGGLLTPFVLQLKQLGLKGVGIYILIIAITSMAVYVFKRWRLLQVSTVFGAYMVTTYFITVPGMSAEEKVLLAVLITVLMVLFTGVEYVLAFIGKSSSRFPAITYGFQSSLPLVTMIQVWNLLEVENRQWALFFGIVCILYFFIAYFFNRYEKDGVQENITIGLTGAFALMALVLWFGQDIRPVAVGVLALIYYGLAIRMKEKFVRYVGHAVGLAAFVIAMIVMYENGDNELMTLSMFLIRILTGLLMVAMALLNKDIERKIIGSLALGVYLMPVVMIEVVTHVREPYELSVTLLAYGLFFFGVTLLNRYLAWLPKPTLIFLGLLPLLIRVNVMEDLLDGYMDIYIHFMLSMILYGVIIYGTAFLEREQLGQKTVMTLKIAGYTMVYMSLVIEFSYLSGEFLFGLVSAGLLIFVQDFAEPDREALWLRNFLTTVRSLWFLGVIGYVGMEYINYDDTFRWQIMIANFSLMILAFLHLKYYRVEVSKTWMAGIMGLLFMTVTYQDFEPLKAGTGITTLLWASYAIGLLAYSVIKVNRKLVNLSMIFIVIVAVKFVLIDLASVTNLWKIIVSMAFGSALLILSYLLQPILKRNEEM